uniref:Uncharacterized protein n=1 Tax=Cucumis melo TaxID=3656 RepID=A0A9I9EFB8_CUCME
MATLSTSTSGFLPLTSSKRTTPKLYTSHFSSTFCEKSMSNSDILQERSTYGKLILPSFSRIV